MKRGRLNLILSAVVLLFAGYVYVFEFKKGQSDEKKKDLETLLLPGLAADEISHIEWWTGPNKSLMVDKKAGVWTLTVAHPPTDPLHALIDRANAEQVQNFLGKLLQARATETVVEGAFDEKTFGLDMPQFEIKLDPAHGLRVGSIKAYDASLYVQAGNEHAVRLAPNSLLELFKKNPSELREKNLYREPVTVRWSEILVSKEKSPSLSLKLINKNWVSGNDAGLKLDASLVEAYLKRIQNIKAVDFTYEGAGAKELKAFKLDPPYMTVQLRDDKQNEWILRLSAVKPALGSSPNSPSNAQPDAMRVSVAATATGVPAIVKILDTNLKIIDQRAEDFVAKPKSSPSSKPSPAPAGAANGI